MIRVGSNKAHLSGNLRDCSDLSFRPATPSDIPAIADLVNNAFKIETFFDGIRTDEQNIAEMMRTGTFIVMEDGLGQLLASVYIELRGERGYLGMFSVAPSYQSRGFGRLMVKAAEQFCQSQGCRFIDVKMLSPRTVLLPFYHSMGYKEIGIEAFPSTRRLKQEGLECHFVLLSKEL
jgi:GNAT superfamily N-acetyltransferase